MFERDEAVEILNGKIDDIVGEMELIGIFGTKREKTHILGKAEMLRDFITLFDVFVDKRKFAVLNDIIHTFGGVL